MRLYSPDQEMSDEEASIFLKALQQRESLGSFEAAYQTVKYLRKQLQDESWETAGEAIKIVKGAGTVLMKGQKEYSIGNMVRRVLKVIKEEYHSSGKDKTDERDTQQSLQKLLLADDVEDKYNNKKPDLDMMVIGAIEELLVELENSSENVCANCLEYIQADEVIMTSGYSRLVEKFLKRAAKHRKFKVIVVEGGPEHKGHKMAVSLAESGIYTDVITDAAVFATITRCNRVIIGTRSVMADGGLKAASGVHTLALAAKHYSVPVIVLAPMYKLSPLYLSAGDQDKFNHMISPHTSLPYSMGSLIGNVSVYSPLYDYVPPNLVALYATNIGGYAPSYIYRLLADLYHFDDYILENSNL